MYKNETPAGLVFIFHTFEQQADGQFDLEHAGEIHFSPGNMLKEKLPCLGSWDWLSFYLRNPRASARPAGHV